MDKEKFSFMQSIIDVLHGISNFPLDVKYFVAAQFALESSFGQSNLAKENYNFSGMKNPLVRISCAKHCGDAQYHWASYNTLTHCVYDFLLCLQYHRPLSCDYDTVQHYMRFISKFYCPEKDYIDRIYKIYVQFKNFKQNGN